jgi:hypothetical protein
MALVYHFLDNNICKLYPEIYYYENILGIPKEFGIARYLIDNVKNISIILSSNFEIKQKATALSKAARYKYLGSRGHLWIDLLSLTWTFILLAACPISTYLSGNPIGTDYKLFVIICTLFTLIGFILVIYALGISQKSVSSNKFKRIMVNSK